MTNRGCKEEQTVMDKTNRSWREIIGIQGNGSQEYELYHNPPLLHSSPIDGGWFVHKC